MAHSSHHLILPFPRRPLTGPTPPKLDPRMKRRTTPPGLDEIVGHDHGRIEKAKVFSFVVLVIFVILCSIFTRND